MEQLAVCACEVVWNSWQCEKMVELAVCACEVVWNSWQL